MKNKQSNNFSTAIDWNNIKQRLTAFRAIGQLYRVDDNHKRWSHCIRHVEYLLLHLTELHKHYAKNKNILKQCGINFIKGHEWIYVPLNEINEDFRSSFYSYTMPLKNGEIIYLSVDDSKIISVGFWKNFLTFCQKYDILSVQNKYIQINFINLQRLALKSMELFHREEKHTYLNDKQKEFEEQFDKEWEALQLKEDIEMVNRNKAIIKNRFNIYVSQRLEKINRYKNTDNNINSEKQNHWDNLDKLIQSKKNNQ